MTMKQNKENFNFKAFEKATKAAWKANGISRNQLTDTHNLVRWLPDGSKEYLGRIDEQVKNRGFRIELPAGNRGTAR